MNTWLIIALALYSLGITAVLFVEWNKERPSKKFIRSSVERIFSTPKIIEKGGYRPKGVFVNHG